MRPKVESAIPSVFVSEKHLIKAFNVLNGFNVRSSFARFGPVPAPTLLAVLSPVSGSD